MKSPGDKTSFGPKLVLKEISPPILDLLYLCLGWLIFFMGFGHVKTRFEKLLN
jgi:hypothetical protein